MTDLETRLRQDAKRLPCPPRDELCARIIDCHEHADIGPLPGSSRARWPMAVAAVALVSISVALIARATAPVPASSTPTAALPSAPDRIVLPAVDWTAPWKLDVSDPLTGEFAHLQADMRGASRFLADRLPSLRVREVN